MTIKQSVMALILLLAGLCAACGGSGSNQGELPTIMPTAAIEQVATEAPVFSTPNVNQGLEGSPTMDMAAIASTSEVVGAPIQRDLSALTGIGSVLSVSASASSAGGIVVLIEAEIPPEGDNETTMASILQVVQTHAGTVARIQLRNWSGTVLQRTWVWENGSWTSQ